MKKILFAALVCILVVAVLPFAGALTSGALLLLMPVGVEAQDHDLDDSYKPRHKGYIHLGTGLYIREDEDLIVRGTPTLMLRRTYLSGYRMSREFGVGTTHNGGQFLEGDPERFQWVQLVPPDGGRVRFERTSSGTSYYNAMYEHRSTPSEWQGARLGWTGAGWALRRRDGSLLMFQGCGGSIPVCWILWERDADGHRIDYVRRADGRLLRIAAGEKRWIAFDYDGQNRITRAYDSTDQAVKYEYDAAGRLTRATSSSGREDRFGYTDRDQMAAITAPEMRIENTYDDTGRCIKQVDHFPDDPEPYTFNFAYQVSGDQVVRADTTRSDGTWTRYVYSRARYIVEESWGSEGYQPLTFKYERDPVSSRITSVALTCPDRKGRSTTHAAMDVRPDSEEWIKWDSIRTHCAWRSERWRSAE